MVRVCTVVRCTRHVWPLRSFLVVTGHELVEGSSRLMREDVCKKHMSAEHLASRMPFAIMTKEVELVGRKRFELNSSVSFVCVNMSNSDSIFQRS